MVNFTRNPQISVVTGSAAVIIPMLILCIDAGLVAIGTAHGCTNASVVRHVLGSPWVFAKSKVLCTRVMPPLPPPGRLPCLTVAHCLLYVSKRSRFCHVVGQVWAVLNGVIPIYHLTGVPTALVVVVRSTRIFMTRATFQIRHISCKRGIPSGSPPPAAVVSIWYNEPAFQVVLATLSPITSNLL